MPPASTCGNCRGQNISDTREACPRCGTQSTIQKCDDCGYTDRAAVQPECDCWAGY